MQLCSMKKLNFTLVISIIVLGLACKSQNRVDAKIYERKEEEGNRLLIKYQYQVNGKDFRDSATINNIVLDSDTISIKYETDHPERTTPEVRN